jgi:hypothetical protein
MANINHVAEAARYGNLVRVAITFHVANGNEAELDAAYWYARYAARHAVMATTN